MINEYSVVGIIGVSLYVPTSLFFLWQTYFSFKEENKLTHKTVGHFCLLAYSILELSYASEILVARKITLAAYMVHEVALFFNYVAFNTVVDFWAKTLQLLVASNKIVDIVLFITISMNFVVLVLFIVISVSQGEDCVNNSLLCRNVLIAQRCSNSSNLCLLSVVMTVLGFRLQVHLGSSRDSRLLWKINMIVASCTICYLIRVMFVIYTVYILFYDDTTSFETVLNDQILWFLFSKWIPLLVPSYMIAYLMRPKQSYLCWDLPATNQSSKKREHNIDIVAIAPSGSSHNSFSSTESTFYSVPGQGHGQGHLISVHVDSGSRTSYNNSIDRSYNNSIDLYASSPSALPRSVDMARTSMAISIPNSDSIAFDKPVYGSPVNTSSLVSNPMLSTSVQSL